jgi:iron(III) transport system ATP-binding protein
MYLQIRNIVKNFSGTLALNDVSLEIGQHEFVCLLGPSGCGKTTLLRIIAGLMPMDGGSLILAGQDLSRVPAHRRGFGIVFQSYSLFPNMTVAQNVGYGLKIRGVGAAEAGEKVRRLLDMVKLPQVADRYPWQLSGGQQQRVALARALAVEPSLLLLDEPLSALDAKVRTELREEIRDMQQRLRIPTIMVTHDQEEALTLADKVVCMSRGVVEQVGRPEDLYLHPRTRFVADFMGTSNLLERAIVATHLPHLLTSGQDAPLACIRPEKISLEPAVSGLTGGQAGVQSGKVESLTFLGNLTRIRLGTAVGPLVVEQPGVPRVTVGQTVGWQVRPEDCVWVAA